MSNLRQEFIAFSVNAGVIRFGDFVTKAGRNSPYFFNAGCLMTALISANWQHFMPTP
jgi:orotate phosphoribosyltransferase